MRLFVAVVPPDDVLADLDRFVEPRRAVDGPRWSDPAMWHVTLAFAGRAPERALDELVDRLRDTASTWHPAPLALAGGGCFPDVTRARVLWCGVRGGDSLAPLARSARAAAAVSGAAPEGGPFHPHLTLARFGRPADGTRWVRLLDGYRGPEWTPDEALLVESHLPRDRGHRPRHEVLERFPISR